MTPGFAEPLPKGLIKVNQKVAPQFVLSDMDAHSYDLKRAKGKWVFIHFWASWCGPCRKEIPEIEKLVKTGLAKKMEVVIINTGETEDTIFTFLSEFAPGLKTFMDTDGLVTEAYSPRGLPATYLVNPAGEIVYQALGGLPWTHPEYYQFLLSLTARP